MSGVSREIKEDLKMALKDENKLNEYIDKYFNETDKEQSGYIDLDEFVFLEKKFCALLDLPEPNREEVALEFKRIDKDKSGSISKEEFRKVVRELCIYA